MHDRSDWTRFLVPSLLGVLLFLTPLPVDDHLDIGVGVLNGITMAAAGDTLPAIVTAVVTLSALVSLLVWLLRPAWSRRDGPMAALFAVGPPTLLVRVAAAVLALMTLTGAGPRWVVSEDTGQVILGDLMTVILVLFLYAALALPLLTDFGLMEFVGTLLQPVFRPLFRLPGRSSIDALASWLGSAPVGVLISLTQHRDGHYSAREAAVIATNFSVVSIAFAVVVVDFVDLGAHLIPYYLTLIVCGVVAAVLTPRLWPLASIPDVDADGRPSSRARDELPAGSSRLGHAVDLALARARRAPPPGRLLRRGAGHVADIWFGLEPLVMVIGTCALAVAEHTPVFGWIAAPLVPALDLLGVPEAAGVAPALLVGFADQFLPVILGQALESPVARFVVACASVTQLIYMSEVGALLLRSELPLSLGRLAAIFLIRTAITVPIAVVAARLIF